MSMQFVYKADAPVVETKAGSIRGFCLNSTYIFRGIKYADSDRFMMPVPVKSWQGIKDAFVYGYNCPLTSPASLRSDDLLFATRYWPENEDCQYLNIWTQSLERKAKKPVMFWIHGGGYFSGSSTESAGYDGENLSKFGDAVVVSINHRLNILGHLNLAEFGSEYKNSANAGIADIVAALQWVHDNIEGFGGDPDNVTIFGQSGGGGKVITLLQTPDAAGLFSKAIIQSGIYEYGPVATWESSTAIAEAILRELDIPKLSVEKLQSIPLDILVQTYNKIKSVIAKQGQPAMWAPVANDYYIGDPLQVGFTENAKKTPVLIGSVISEFAFDVDLPALTTLSDDDKHNYIKTRYGSYSKKLTELFTKAYPGKDILNLIFLDSDFRLPVIEFMDMKTACSDADDYAYVLAYNFPYDYEKPAWHSAEIPLVFRNVDLIPAYTGSEALQRLQGQMCSSWVSFAKSGNPCNPSVPDWHAYKKGSEAAMVFDETCAEMIDHDRKLVAMHRKSKPEFVFNPD